MPEKRLPPEIEAAARRIHAVLPQTQCTRCGYPDCAAYAEAIAAGEAPLNRCPPGGAEGIERLSALTGQPALPLDPVCGAESPRAVAIIDEDWCIGCMLCLKVCPTDAIVGSHKRMHTVIEPYCTGCELCLPVCPVDCIALVNVTEDRTGWQAWSETQAAEALARYEQRQERLAREAEAQRERLEAKARMKLSDLAAHTHGAEGAEAERKRAVIAAALERARAQRR